MFKHERVVFMYIVAVSCALRKWHGIKPQCFAEERPRKIRHGVFHNSVCFHSNLLCCPDGPETLAR